MNFNAKLSEREKEIAELLAWGGARKEVADRLHISIRTIETTTQSIYRKIGIQKAPELSVWWFVTRFNVPISQDPWKRKMIAVFFLGLIIFTEVSGTNFDATRVNQTRVTTIAIRAQRARRE